MLAIRSRNVGRVTVLELSGRLSSGEPTESFLEEVRKAAGDGKGFLLINLEGVAYMDSLGLESLIEVYNSVKASEGEVKLLNPSAKVGELMRLTKLTSVFDIHTDEATAVKAFKG